MQQSVFYPDHLTRQIRHNAENIEWAQTACRKITKAAQPWLDCPDALLWKAMYGPDLKRSWMVWSSGHCPACKDDVSMYGWEIDPAAHPWKVACPHCEELFPKNDFHAYYQSGIDPNGVFDRKIADSGKLKRDDRLTSRNTDAAFGIDDGEGYSDGENTWMFIATYLIYGQWKQFVHAGSCILLTRIP